jgi:hypothetical protein
MSQGIKDPWWGENHAEKDLLFWLSPRGIMDDLDAAIVHHRDDPAVDSLSALVGGP